MTVSARTVGLVAVGVLAGGLVGGLPALAQEVAPSPDSSTTAPAVPGDRGRDGRDCPEEEGAGGGTSGGTSGGSTGTPTAPAPSATSDV